MAARSIGYADMESGEHFSAAICESQLRRWY